MRKPRLKLSSTGKLSVIAPGELGWNARQARTYIQSHYGSVGRFAARFALSYAAACLATRPGRDGSVSRIAGDVSKIRSMLGLRTEPTPLAIRLAQVHPKRRSGDAT